MIFTFSSLSNPLNRKILNEWISDVVLLISGHYRSINLGTWELVIDIIRSRDSPEKVSKDDDDGDNDDNDDDGHDHHHDIVKNINKKKLFNNLKIFYDNLKFK